MMMGSECDFEAIVLASRSGRRAQLMQEWGYRFVQIDPPYEDPASPSSPFGESAGELAVGLAERKARSLFAGGRLPAAVSVVLGADTVVVGHGGVLLGQPGDRVEAGDMLRGLMGREHGVVSGVAVLDREGNTVDRFYDQANVRFERVDEARLEPYLESGLWEGKAGGYNLNEVQSDWSVTVEGDPTTVVGLPMKLLGERLGFLFPGQGWAVCDKGSV